MCALGCWAFISVFIVREIGISAAWSYWAFTISSSEMVFTAFLNARTQKRVAPSRTWARPAPREELGAFCDGHMTGSHLKRHGLPRGKDQEKRWRGTSPVRSGVHDPNPAVDGGGRGLLIARSFWVRLSVFSLRCWSFNVFRCSIFSSRLRGRC